MDIKQAFSVIFDRIERIQPSEQATKILGYLLLAYREEDVIDLAHSSDDQIENVVLLVKKKLSQVALTQPSTLPSFTPSQFNALMPRGISFPAIEKPKPLLYDQQVNGSAYSPLYHDNLAVLQDQTQSMRMADHYDLEGGIYPEEASGHKSRQISRRPLNVSTMPRHFFRGGLCRDGNSCRCYLEQHSPERLSPMLDPSVNQYVNDEQMFLHGPLEKLEMEIVELLKTNGGEPIQITYLPMLYFETYGKPLLADGYRTESQRNGKPGHGLVKLLSCMKNSLRIIDRHGQRSISLAEDAPKHYKYPFFRNSLGPIVSGSTQIYLTFPKESTFTETDVAQYFSKFGEVYDVRIPSQTERMFGFVSFSSPETVKTILSLPKEHFVGGYKVLVKPYREKPKQTDRGVADHTVYSPRCYFDMNTEFQFTPSALEAWASFREQPHMEPDLQGVDMQRVTEFQLARKAETEILPASHPDHLPDSSNDADNILPPDNADANSGRTIELPDSPFSSPTARRIASTISALLDEQPN